MLSKVYIGVGAAVCLWWAVAAFGGWKSPSLGGAGGSRGYGGGFYYGGGGGWGGGK